jgi:flagellar biosynthesis anti-sigma factor FlgM
MNQEQSTSDLDAATGLTEPPSITTTTMPPNAEALAALAAQLNDARFSKIEARVDHLEALALNAPDLRLARVLALKAEISSGTYKVPPLQLADALLDYMRRWAA